MIPYFANSYHRIEKQRESLFKALSALSDQDFNRQPQSGKWSVAEIASHLVAAEKLSVNYMKKKILGAEQIENTGLWEGIKMVLLIASQRLPLKFKAPKVVVEQTSPLKNFKALKQNWDSVREELKAFLEQLPEEYARKKIYRHVRAGRLNAKHALVFFSEHIKHHGPQIKKLISGQ